MIDLDPAEAARRKEIEHRQLQRMIAYADTGDCLRATILRYFGDPAARDRCQSCGHCQPHGTVDAYDRDVVRKILSGIARAGERYGRRRIVAMLVGDTTELPPGLTNLSTTGLLRHEEASTLGQWIDAAVAAGMITISTDQYRTLSLTAHGRDVMAGRVESFQIVPPAAFSSVSDWRRIGGRRGIGDRRARFPDDW